ncbi:putative immunity protein [Kineococcus arenarius]|uniref:putative immunity protein n=1 Tax=unclassified Kineococcus TaxID=2621656 RepID=UPI003D7E5E00
MAPRADSIELSEWELRDVTSFTAGCARTSLGLFEDEHPDDPRSREAIEAAEAFADGGRVGELMRRLDLALRG